MKLNQAQVDEIADIINNNDYYFYGLRTEQTPQRYNVGDVINDNSRACMPISDYLERTECSLNDLNPENIDDDVYYYEDLPGVCCTEVSNLNRYDGTVQIKDEIALNRILKEHACYYGDVCYLIAGDEESYNEYGGDENEIIIKRPVVLAVFLK